MPDTVLGAFQKSYVSFKASRWSKYEPFYRWGNSHLERTRKEQVGRTQISYRQGFDKQDMTLKVGKPNREAGYNAGGETYITTEIKIYYKQTTWFLPTLGFMYSSICKIFYVCFIHNWNEKQWNLLNTQLMSNTCYL